MTNLITDQRRKIIKDFSEVEEVAGSSNCYPRMTEAEYQLLKAKIERQFPIRLALATTFLGRKINIKKHKDLETFDDTITELMQEIHSKLPEKFDEALKLAEKETEWRPNAN